MVHRSQHKVEQTRPGTLVWGESVLRFLERGWLWLRTMVGKWIPEALHPLTQLGAIANVTFIIAAITGVLLLFWYVPSVHKAYTSLEMMKQSPWLAQLLRSLHRYSSDACMLFVLLHAIQIILARKITGPQWLAWITGILAMATLWFVGWTGYWLVWDDRAAQIAVGTSKLLDVLPIFADPLSRSFLVNSSVNSLLFFIIFFFHMLIPLVFAVLIWIHITRLSLSRFLTNSRMTVAICISLVAISLFFPAFSSKPAAMQAVPSTLGMDWFYMLPIYLTERLQGGTLWALSMGVTLIALSMPWWLARRRAPAAVINASRCNACNACYTDCPYNAISMIPREGKYPLLAQVDPAKCVGCGVCVGSCDSYGVTFPALEPLDVRKQMDGWLDESKEKDAPMVAFVCAESAASSLHVDEVTGLCDELPGYRVRPVPCSGWVHMLTIERAIRHGADGVLVAGCGPDAACRLGDTWTTQRIEGKREPQLREDKLNGKPLLHVSFERSEPEAFLKTAKAFREQTKAPPKDSFQRIGAGLVTIVVLMGLGWLIWGLSDATYQSAADQRPMLVVSFKHPGQLIKAKALSKKEQEKLLPHMRGMKQVQRKRVPVRLRVWVDGAIVTQRSFRPKGIFEDGNSIAIERVPVKAGLHKVRVEISDTPNSKEWNYKTSRNIRFRPSYRRVVLFNKVRGFQWH